MTSTRSRRAPWIIGTVVAAFAVAVPVAVGAAASSSCPTPTVLGACEVQAPGLVPDEPLGYLAID